MNEGKSKPPWCNYMVLVIALFLSILVSNLRYPLLLLHGLPEFDHRLRFHVCFTGGIHAIVLARLVIACLRRERNRDWIFYAILCFVASPLSGLAFYIIAFAILAYHH